ncbi:precorrin-6A reductase [Breoghania corrubedonensis]|uniref:Precorrin-6A reductase n=1 Tax=Breoghania corrubedonensis TaxID=665038 RepID=A0A2T5VFS6_9HYPH|nr:cobalt-precorrin-6A reductase [Breoghania corrubedonensis]PTW62604.1 precorrin-6A reductase [Breoghania corrubedonensis]
MSSAHNGPVSILLLAGTAEARELADRLAAVQAMAERRMRVIASLAGATAKPSALGVETRIGGFGGKEGLVGFLREADIDVVVDATHPFAARITANAVDACMAAKIDYLRLERPAWQARPGDDWRSVATLAQAAALLPSGARVFLGIGRKEIATFAERGDVRFVMRMIDPPAAGARVPGGEIVLGRPCAHEGGEIALLRHHAITHVVAKNSGGLSGRAKIDAARTLALPVFMVDRPPSCGGHRVTSVAQAVRWIETWIASA